MSQIIGFIFPKTCEQKHLVLYMGGVVPDTDEFQGFWVNPSQEMMLRKRSFPSWDNPAFTFFLGCYVSFRDGLVTSSSSHIFNFPNEDFWPSICCSNKADFFRAFWLVHNFLKRRFRWECFLLLFVRCLLFTLPNLPQCYLHPEWWFKKGWLHPRVAGTRKAELAFQTCWVKTWCFSFQTCSPKWNLKEPVEQLYFFYCSQLACWKEPCI